MTRKEFISKNFSFNHSEGTVCYCPECGKENILYNKSEIYYCGRCGVEIEVDLGEE